jgi:hypothetical protein
VTIEGGGESVVTTKGASVGGGGPMMTGTIGFGCGSGGRGVGGSVVETVDIVVGFAVVVERVLEDVRRLSLVKKEQRFKLKPCLWSSIF